jgi:hypothetical protein
MNCDARGSELRVFRADLWGIKVLSYSTRGATVTTGTVHVEKAESGAARIAGSRGTPAAGLRPRPAREKGFPSNLMLDLIDTSPLFK